MERTAWPLISPELRKDTEPYHAWRTAVCQVADKALLLKRTALRNQSIYVLADELITRAGLLLEPLLVQQFNLTPMVRISPSVFKFFATTEIVPLCTPSILPKNSRVNGIVFCPRSCRLSEGASGSAARNVVSRVQRRCCLLDLTRLQFSVADTHISNLLALRGDEIAWLKRKATFRKPEQGQSRTRSVTLIRPSDQAHPPGRQCQPQLSSPGGTSTIRIHSGLWKMDSSRHVHPGPLGSTPVQ